MGYTDGTLIKVGNEIIPFRFMKYDSIQCTYETLDLDSYRNGDGDLIRNALANRKIKVEFETPYMYKADKDALMALISRNYVSAQEQSVMLTAYIDEIDDYVTQKAYLVNTTFKKAQNSPNGMIYAPTRICFIGY